MDLAPGTVVANHYRLGKPLGRGGMGEVYGAENVRTGRRVAIKLLRADVRDKKNAVERFRREALAAGRIHSDYVTQVLDVEEDATHGIVIVFEQLDGESLVDRLKRTGPIPFPELHGIIDQAFQGLADAHQAGVIHRDLKPSNVFLERRPNGSDRVKLLDFGIAKLPRELTQETLTAAGQALGTFSFMAPEQIAKAKEVDHRADIYAMATMIFQSLTGQLPYLAKNPLVLVDMKMKTEPRRLSEATSIAIDPALDAFIVKGLARDLNARFQSTAEALAAWRALAPGAQQAPRAAAAVAQTALSAGSAPNADFQRARDAYNQHAQAAQAAQAAQQNGSRAPSTQLLHERGPQQLYANGAAPHLHNPALGGTMLIAPGDPNDDSGATVRVSRPQAQAMAAQAQAAHAAQGQPWAQQQPNGYPAAHPSQAGYSPAQGAPASPRASYPNGNGYEQQGARAGVSTQMSGANPYGVASHPSQSSQNGQQVFAAQSVNGRYASALQLPSPTSVAGSPSPLSHETLDDARRPLAQPAKGSKLPFVMMLILFTLLSFAIVAAALHYSSTGKLL